MSADLSNDQLARILAAVETIDDCISRLAEIRETVDRETYRDDADVQDIVERRFVKMTEAALDIGTVLLIHERGEPAESNPETMRALGEHDVVPSTVAREMEDAARFRNVLAHTYGRSIDHDLVYDALTDLERYRDFVVAVREYLDAVGALDGHE